MSKVFVLDANKQPLAPCHSAVARKLLTSGNASVFRTYPFVIILHRAVDEPNLPPLRLKVDPGSKVSGLAIVNDATGEVVFAAELEHRGETVKARLQSRAAQRRSRRGRKTRYRRPTRPGGNARFGKRRDGKPRHCAVPKHRREEWLPPSLLSRVANLTTWVGRLGRWCPISQLSLELVRFDLQALENPEISGVEYQRGELAGFEVREYLLLKFGHRCVYCGVTGLPLELDHIHPSSRGGSDRISNLVTACRSCNQRKGNQTAEEFGSPQVSALARQPLRDVAAVNSTRWALYERLTGFGLAVETGSGGLTKFNRIRRGMPKSHWADAANVGRSTPETLDTRHVRVYLVTATGHGSRQMCRVDRFGFPRTTAKQTAVVSGFRTGDLVTAVVTGGKKAGTYSGRVAVRSSGSFNITTATGTVQGISYRCCRIQQRRDGYRYAVVSPNHLQPERRSSPA